LTTTPATSDQARILYLAPDLSDPAVDRRRTMLEAGGAQVAIAGFIRGDAPPPPPKWEAEVLGRTQDAALVQRALMVARRLINPLKFRRQVQGQDAVLARNLEMLVLAWAGLALAGSRAKLCYEVLDIHRVMLGEGLKSRLLRRVEALLLKRVDLLVISSNAFDHAYFQRLQPTPARRLLLENKLLVLDGDIPAPLDPPAGPPWRIGWFGMLRCKRSLEILGRLAQSLPGLVEVDIRGRPSPAVFGEDFDAAVAQWPGLVFHGPYRSNDLAAAYGAVHFVWAVDFYEAGQNSDWLLPNRLYEGNAHGRPLIALGTVETGRWLARHKAGALFDDLEGELPAFLTRLTPDDYKAYADGVARLPAADLFATRDDCRDLVGALTGRRI
jgi:hypothetical protein